MTDYLRTISVSVDETDPGSFFWVLMESTEDATIFDDLASAKVPEPTWEAALDAGVAALKALAKDRTIGPRSDVEDEGADPVG
ncbi:hypothetical protein ACSFA3_20940 [Variovorax sp. RHLX14]|uniref:hypothetical protein n=1 Tax=Variovorax sp. RHLX14 TaxID=1259731 RepID=UPI003F4842A9